MELNPLLTSLTELDSAFRAAWDADTCDPHDYPWSADNPSRGQCGVTTLVLHDLLGGELLLGSVTLAGKQTGVHWWLRLAGGVELDLTREQFHPGEVVSEGAVVVRPDGPPGRCREQYELLRQRVFAALGVAPSWA
ncbi:MAG TPA: hypothetical protein DGT23_33605 [Micromonosporaceae bacterium]|nr:hypothetical protein [Micromonosporaceae bacterium]